MKTFKLINPYYLVRRAGLLWIPFVYDCEEAGRARGFELSPCFTRRGAHRRGREEVARLEEYRAREADVAEVYRAYYAVSPSKRRQMRWRISQERWDTLQEFDLGLEIPDGRFILGCPVKIRPGPVEFGEETPQ